MLFYFLAKQVDCRGYNSVRPVLFILWYEGVRRGARGIHGVLLEVARHIPRTSRAIVMSVAIARGEVIARTAIKSQAHMPRKDDDSCHY